MKFYLLLVFLIFCSVALSEGTYSAEEWSDLKIIEYRLYEDSEDCDTTADAVSTYIKDVCYQNIKDGRMMKISSTETIDYIEYDDSTNCSSSPHTNTWDSNECIEGNINSQEFLTYSLTKFIVLANLYGDSTNCSDTTNFEQFTILDKKCYIDPYSNYGFKLDISAESVKRTDYSTRDCSGSSTGSFTENYDQCFSSDNENGFYITLQYASEDGYSSNSSSKVLFSTFLLLFSFLFFLF
ncbi:hypothetical protein M0812_19719 [Anaeramoeba flamelloides]|uniref:Uncharacterized protein n=1 Tax=Anaeramoeba flamelloides TaxID=1746091 RepID=A0AAV7Z386_9EUKA|nr:hypothetical protein M0812_19719 [Anaeramoeba flamelloides]